MRPLLNSAIAGKFRGAENAAGTDDVRVGGRVQGIRLEYFSRVSALRRYSQLSRS